ncbi:MAG TPA: isocitrate lyase/PEP mutase family protein [Candidatus Angelobacter sp.]|nr:isocitrate lyase/PEP mutase family protein [Candidatus Angelobacter sp.]
MKRQLSPNGKPAVNGHIHKSATAINGHGKTHHADGNEQSGLMSTALLPEGYYVPATRNVNPSTRMRQLLETEPYLFGPGVYDPMTAQLVMYYGFKAIYFSGYSFAMGYLGTTDMDLYSGPEIADAARRTVSALRKFQLTQAVGDPEKGTLPRHLDIPPLIVDMDGGYGNIFNVQRTTELYVNAGVAAAHIEDQVLPKRCGHIGGKALIPVNEMVGKLRMARAVADDCGNEDFVLIARTDGLSAVDAPESQRGIELAVERGLRYLDTGIPDLVWCEFPTSDRGPVEQFCDQICRRFPQARFAFNWSSSFKWFNDPNPMTFAELGEMGVKFIFITLGAQHATGHGLSVLLRQMSEQQQHGYIELQKKEWEKGGDFPTRSHHFFSGVPYHHVVGKMYDAARLGKEFCEELPEEKVV